MEKQYTNKDYSANKKKNGNPYREKRKEKEQNRYK